MFIIPGIGHGRHRVAEMACVGCQTVVVVESPLVGFVASSDKQAFTILRQTHIVVAVVLGKHLEQFSGLQIIMIDIVTLLVTQEGRFAICSVHRPVEAATFPGNLSNPIARLQVPFLYDRCLPVKNQQTGLIRRVTHRCNSITTCCLDTPYCLVLAQMPFDQTSLPVRHSQAVRRSGYGHCSEVSL